MAATATCCRTNASYTKLLIPIFQPFYDEREEQAVARVLRSKWVGLGPVTEEFERAFASRVGARYAVAVNSGTAALHIALRLLDISAGDEVLVPTITFVSTIRLLDSAPVVMNTEPTGGSSVRNRVNPSSICDGAIGCSSPSDVSQRTR